MEVGNVNAAAAMLAKAEAADQLAASQAQLAASHAHAAQLESQCRALQQ